MKIPKKAKPRTFSDHLSFDENIKRSVHVQRDGDGQSDTANHQRKPESGFSRQDEAH